MHMYDMNAVPIKEDVISCDTVSSHGEFSVINENQVTALQTDNGPETISGRHREGLNDSSVNFNKICGNQNDNFVLQTSSLSKVGKVSNKKTLSVCNSIIEEPKKDHFDKHDQSKSIFISPDKETFHRRLKYEKKTTVNTNFKDPESLGYKKIEYYEQPEKPLRKTHANYYIPIQSLMNENKPKHSDRGISHIDKETMTNDIFIKVTNNEGDKLQEISEDPDFDTEEKKHQVTSF